jgi:hypothetical protein
VVLVLVVGDVAAGAAHELGEFFDAVGGGDGVADPGEVLAFSGVGHKGGEGVGRLCPLPAAGLLAVPAVDAAAVVVQGPIRRWWLRRGRI